MPIHQGLKTMATINDLYEIREILKIVREDAPCCKYLGDICFSYASGINCYTATIDSDLTVLFNDVEYGSNCIYLRMDGKDVAYFCHTHQRMRDLIE